jgi:hypothetical protein
MPSWKLKTIGLLLAVSVLSLTACQDQQPTAAEQWLPPYLHLQLRAGKAQVQWPGSSGWTTVEGKASIAVEEEIGMIADMEQGAQFLLGDGSTLELEPQTRMQLQNLHTFPRLHMVLQEGALLFVAQGTTYEFVVPACLVTILSAPAHLDIRVKDGGTHLVVQEGAIACETDAGIITLPSGQEMHMASPDAEPEITEYTDTEPTATVLALTPSSKSTTTTPPTPTPTSTPTPTPTATPPPVTQAPPTPTNPPAPPTEPPAPPPTKRPRQTEPPPTNPPPPPPTNPPPTNPPPTNPPPRPTEPPERPTPTP